MSKRTTSIFAVLLVVAILFIIIRRESLVEGYAFKADMAEAAASTLAALAALALVVERAMAPINAIVFGTKQRAAELTQDKSEQDALLSEVFGAKERARILMAFIAGLFISAAGVRTLSGLLQVTAPEAPANPLLFPVDVVLTAALIAGGSNGLAFLLQMGKETLTSENSASQTRKQQKTVQTVFKRAGEQPEEPSPSVRARLITTG